MKGKISCYFFFDNKLMIIFRFTYTPSDSWFGLSSAGQVSNYDQGGYIVTCGTTKEEFMTEIAALKDK
jgi:hypothetical protein